MSAWLINSISSSFPCPENGEWVWKFQASSHGLVFLVTSPLPRSLPRIGGLWKGIMSSVSNTGITLELRSFRSSLSGTRVKNEVLTGTEGRDQYIFFIISQIYIPFWKTFYLEIILDLQSHCKISTEFPYALYLASSKASILHNQ